MAINYYNGSIKANEEFPNAYKELGLLQLKIDIIEICNKSIQFCRYATE
mgnify:CR=1 FL=1